MRKWMIITVILLLIVGIGLTVILNINPLEGVWYMDDVTAYRFENGGKGTMLLPSVEYTFTYEVEDNILRIDFDYEGAKDAEYIFEIDGDTLSMVGGNATVQGEYSLTKKGAE